MNVSDGIGLGVSEAEDISVAGFVGVFEAVSVGASRVTVSVAGENAVFVGGSVPAMVGGNEVDVEVQANKVNIHRLGRMSLRLMV
jgi:hypothetical protein